MEEIYDISMSLLVALSIGLLIGIERGWKDRKQEEGDRIAGIRTFSLIGLLGGIWALLSNELSDWMLVIAFFAVSILIIVAYILDVRENKDVGATTAFAMMLTFALSAWSVYGYKIPALGVTVVVIALLGYKPVLHGWLRKIQQKELLGGIKLLVISVVLLPLLPNQGYGPWEVLNPYWLWWMVVLICGLSFIGYISVKIAGDKLGTLVTAITGGLASSTAVTLSLAQMAKESRIKSPFIGGVMLASSMKFVRVFIEVSIVNPGLLKLIWLPLTVMFTGVLAGGFWIWRDDTKCETGANRDLHLKNPFQIGTALKFGVMLAGILVLAEGFTVWFGDTGVYALSAVSGLVNMDAITLSLSRVANTSLNADVAATGIILAAATNTLIKGFIFAFFVGIRESLRLILLLTAAVVTGLAVAGYMFF